MKKEIPEEVIIPERKQNSNRNSSMMLRTS